MQRAPSIPVFKSRSHTAPLSLTAKPLAPHRRNAAAHACACHSWPPRPQHQGSSCSCLLRVTSASATCHCRCTPPLAQAPTTSIDRACTWAIIVTTKYNARNNVLLKAAVASGQEPGPHSCHQRQAAIQARPAHPTGELGVGSVCVPLPRTHTLPGLTLVGQPRRHCLSCLALYTHRPLGQQSHAACLAP